MMRRFVVILACLTVLTPAAAVSQQVIRGGERAVATVLAGAQGVYIVSVPAPGIYRMRFERVDYESVEVGAIELRAGEVLVRNVEMAARAIELSGIEVEVEARSRMLDRVGFDERQRLTSGTFLDPEAIEARNTIRVRDLLSTIGGLTLITDMSGLRPTLMTRAGLDIERRSGARTCLPVIYMDGLRVQEGGRDPFRVAEFDLAVIPMMSVVAVEVYDRGLNVPVPFGGPNAVCGVIMLWTRAGCRRRGGSRTSQLWELCQPLRILGPRVRWTAVLL